MPDFLTRHQTSLCTKTHCKVQTGSLVFLAHIVGYVVFLVVSNLDDESGAPALLLTGCYCLYSSTVLVPMGKPLGYQWENHWDNDFSCKTHKYRHYHTCHHKRRRQFSDGPVPKNDNLKCVKSFQQQIPFYGTHDQIWVKIGTTDLHMMLLSICRFRENMGRETPSFLTGLNYITYKPCECRKDLRNFKSNERLCKACVLRQGELFAILLRTLWEHFLIKLRLLEKLKLFSARQCNVARFYSIYYLPRASAII
jgi:hypothetical protein